MVTTEQIKELRDKTGISIAECKKALEEAQGDMAKALELLSARAAVIAGKKADRELGAGTVAA
jgi:elongation factor Ts